MSVVTVTVVTQSGPESDAMSVVVRETHYLRLQTTMRVLMSVSVCGGRVTRCA